MVAQKAMSIREFLSKMDSMDSDERGRLFPSVVAMLTPMSKQTLTNFQNSWDGTRPYEEFVKEQNKVLRNCIEIEVGELGKGIRMTQQLEPLDLEHGIWVE